ncbi:hypothetical protein GGI00_002235 [Coemansia sp. RSA 2681]|nr:hypothetical protein GGI00_002235 [Coemansia sp. RSA 2681]
MLTRQNSAPAAGKPSPYTAKAQPHSGEAVRAGIGGPPKHRESMSGMGNNLRSHHPAGLGRSVARSSTLIQNLPPPPLQRALSSEADSRPVYRRGSLGTAAAATADASQHVAGSTVFPTNRGHLAQSMSPPPPPGQTAQPPPNVRIVHRAHSLSADRRTNNPHSPTRVGSAGLDIGSPATGDIVDILGSPSRPSVIYAPARRGSGIGGGTSSKQAMQERPGLGGKYGKDWMADRPSGIGAPAPQNNNHPESGISKVLRSLSISRKEKGAEASENL